MFSKNYRKESKIPFIIGKHQNTNKSKICFGKMLIKFHKN